MRIKNLLPIVVLSIIGLLGNSIAWADSSEESYYPDVKHEPGWMGITFDNSISLVEPSRLFAQLIPHSGDAQGQKMFVCTSTKDAPCQDPAYGYIFHSNLTECSTPSQNDCIQEFGKVNADGSITDAVHTTDYVNNGSFTGDPAIGLPDGHGPNIWTLKDGSNNQTYAVNIGLDGDWIRSQSKVNIYGFSASIQPVKEVMGPEYHAPRVTIVKRSFGDGPGWDTMALIKGCQIYEEGKCALRQSFDLNSNYVLKVRLSQPINGWLHGRMNSANFDLKTNPDNSVLLTITAKPLAVPMVNGWAKWTDLPENIKALYPVGTGGTGGSLDDFVTKDLAKRTLLTQSQVAGQQAINEMNAWLPLLSNKANNMKTLWSARTMNGQLPIDTSKCPNSGGLTGIVGTNAAVYSDGPPAFDPSTSSLNYTVGAPHFDSAGTVFNGFYQLNLRSDIARCIYGFSKAPISAKVEIASSDGTPRVAVTSLTEKNGWLNLTAAGFEFSTPKISVKLQQEGTTTATTAKAIAKKTTCIKGKISKVVTTATCPTGYKKK